MLLINQSAQFKEAMQNLMTQEVVAIDTEFIRRHTYFAKLALVQISTKDEIYIIDPKAVDIKPLKELLVNKDIVKIFHACMQDVKIFYDLFSTPTMNIFDTQAAVQFLGLQSQISYQNACSSILHIAIDKEQQFREWGMRPLPKDMLLYAAQDVLHLIPMYLKLKRMLEEKNIYVNFCTYMKSYSEKEFYQVKFDDVWKKIKTREFGVRFQRKLQVLGAFRESCAIELDVPRVRAISDYDIALISQRLPTTHEELTKLNLRLTGLTRSHVSKLLDICAGLRSDSSR